MPSPDSAPSWSSLSLAQKEVMWLLGDRGPMRTSKTTHHDVVSGACAAGLVNRGLVRRIGRWQDEVELTDLGRQVLDAR